VLEPGIPKARAILEKEGLPVTDENIFIVGALATAGGNKGLDFLKGNKPINVRKVSEETAPEKKAAVSVPARTATGPSQYKVTVDGETYQVLVEDDTGEILEARAADSARKEAAEAPAVEVRAQLPGNVYEVLCAEGDRIAKGDTLVILEAMKMETLVTAPEDGIISSVDVEKGQTVKSGQLIATIS